MTESLRFAREDFNPGQWEFLRCDDPFALLAGGVGSGKTTALCVKALLLRERNWGFPGLLVAPTGPMLKGVTLRELHRIYRLTYPDRPRPRVKDWTGDRYLEFFDGGAPIFLRTASHPESIEGFSVAYALMDEARWCPEASYRNTISRVRLRAPCCQTALASTPSMGWMCDEFNGGKPKRRLIIAPTRENIRNLRDGFIEDLRASFSPRIARAILEGEFLPLEGVVFDAFDPRPGAGWLVDWFPTKRDLERCRVELAVDPGWRRSSWLFIIEIRPMDWIVFDELVLDNTSDMSAVQIVNQRGYPIDEIDVDPAAEAHQSATGTDTRRVLQHIDMRDEHHTIRVLTSRFRDISWGVDKLRVLLGGYEGYPIRVRFSTRLVEIEKKKNRGILKDLSSLRYPEVRDGRAIDDRPLKDGVFDHGCDALRYWSAIRTLSCPELRSKDPDLAKDKSLGVRLAA